MTALIVTAFLLTAIVAPEPCQGGLLPAPLRTLLAKEFPAWRIVTVADLRTDDQKLWGSFSGRACAGIAIGHFHSPKQLSYAVLLHRRGAAGLEERLLVARRTATGAFRFQDVMPPAPTDVLGVIHKEPPGEYASSDGSEKVKVATEVIVHEVLEAGAIAYYWRGDGFHSILISD